MYIYINLYVYSYVSHNCCAANMQNLQHTVNHCNGHDNTLQHTATHFNTLQHLQHTLQQHLRLNLVFARRSHGRCCRKGGERESENTDIYIL